MQTAQGLFETGIALQIHVFRHNQQIRLRFWHANDIVPDTAFKKLTDSGSWNFDGA